jgi:hypothetical protein
MLRRILTCLALITGLAAVGAPADARMTLDVAQQVEITAGTAQAGQTAPCVVAQQKLTSRAKDAPLGDCKRRKPLVIFIPTVQFGPDRALE